MYQLLIVDDEKSVADYLQFELPWETLGVTSVHACYSAMDAIEAAKANPVHILITDIRMPKMTGLELIKLLKKLHPKMKCIILSGFADFAYAQKAMESNTDAYLLKPVRDSELLATVKDALDKIRLEWEEISTYRKALGTMREHLPLLRGHLLNELLQGKRFTMETLDDKLKRLELPFRCGDDFTLLFVRMEADFSVYDSNDRGLMEYAVLNIAEELMQEDYHLWSCRDAHDLLILAVICRNDRLKTEERSKVLEQRALELQRSVVQYLKGHISVVVGNWGVFPADTSTIYQAGISALRKFIGGDREGFVPLQTMRAQEKIPVLQRWYEPPSLLHLLEAGRWEEAEEKTRVVFEELTEPQFGSQEHLLEMYHVMSAAFIHLAHKNDHYLVDLIGSVQQLAASPESFKSPPMLRDWALLMISRLRGEMHTEATASRSTLIKRVQTFVQQQLHNDVSLQSLSEQLYVHPVYISKLYKAETGENLSDYLLRCRMEKAAHLLKTTMMKIFEVGEAVGYRNAPYFINVFRKYYGVPPQEFRKHAVD